MSKPETIRTGKAGRTELRLVARDGRYFGLAGGVIKVEGEAGDEVWRRLHEAVGKAPKAKGVGFAAARARFLAVYPGGFEDPAYEARERAPTLEAKAILEAGAPVEDAATGSGYGEAALAAFCATRLFSPFERARLAVVLRGRAADKFIRAAAWFTIGDGDRKAALAEMERMLKPQEAAKWTVASFLPFLWRPEAHMFLRPEATKDFAVRVGHRFAADCEPRLRLEVYESLLDLAEQTQGAIEDMGPRDRIDVQAFIGVVGEHDEAR
jgi:hypothetical protein